MLVASQSFDISAFQSVCVFDALVIFCDPFSSPESVAPFISLTSLSVAPYPWLCHSSRGESELLQEIDETIKTLEGLYTEAASYVVEMVDGLEGLEGLEGLNAV